MFLILWLLPLLLLLTAVALITVDFAVVPLAASIVTYVAVICSSVAEYTIAVTAVAIAVNDEFVTGNGGVTTNTAVIFTAFTFAFVVSIGQTLHTAGGCSHLFAPAFSCYNYRYVVPINKNRADCPIWESGCILQMDTGDVVMLNSEDSDGSGE